MGTKMSVIVAFLAALLMSGNVFAEAEPGQGYFTAMGSYIDDDDDRAVEDAVNGGQFGLGKALNENWNLEWFISMAYPEISGAGDRQDRHLGVGADLQRVFRRSERFSPYIHAGLGYFNVNPDNGPVEDGPMFSAGLGFLTDLGSSDVALRAEWRHRIDDATNGSMADNLFSLGLQIPLGEPSPKYKDSDGDGVDDALDRCPDTPAGAEVDAYGCEKDDDGDGVKNSMDRCPNTPAGMRVDANGCVVDSDGDGVSDDKDKCPNTVRGATVGDDGCELDGDNDGVVDRLDECPDSAAGVQVDIKGCEIKEEIRLPGVNFESNSDTLLPGATRVLDDAAASLRKNPTIKVEVAGHTDSDGAAEYNEGLSARRAQTVLDYLISSGIAEDRMTARGYGEAEPIAGNDTAEGKAQNRRVVLRIVER